MSHVSIFGSVLVPARLRQSSLRRVRTKLNPKHRLLVYHRHGSLLLTTMCSSAVRACVR